MKLWADYIKELRGPNYRTFIEYPDCFVAYSLPEWSTDTVIIYDMYVPEHLRRHGRGWALLKEVESIGRKAGRKYIVSELELSTLSFEVAFRAQVAGGFIPIEAHNGIILMRKEIPDGEG